VSAQTKRQKRANNRKTTNFFMTTSSEGIGRNNYGVGLGMGYHLPSLPCHLNSHSRDLGAGETIGIGCVAVGALIVGCKIRT
jgi:hypothetical protein